MMRLCLLLAGLAGLAWAAPPEFRQHTIAADLRGGYQVMAHDVNGDGKPDLIALASGLTDLLWFENPGWQRRVLASGLRRMINGAACAGMEEIAVAHAFENQPQNSIGIVSVLTPGPDRTQPWAVKEIDRLTTSHRLRCADIDGGGKIVVVNAPLAGAAATAPDYRDHVPLVFYRPGEWKRQNIGSENEGVVHGIFIHRPDKSKRDAILTASFLGIHQYLLGKNGKWGRTMIAGGSPAPWPRSGASDIAVGKTGKARFLASIEPWHGNQVVIYTPGRKLWKREVIDDSLVDGHTILTADFDGDGKEEVVAGFRGAGRSVFLYQFEAKQWRKYKVDDGGIAAAACAASDLNQDGRLDLACIGSATTNLKWYENLGPALRGAPLGRGSAGPPPVK
ncbi:MAG: VCBS repeat-containing protein [Acidobacteriia bacterium]|nr:VCBS repeat-containing protein [Terriglobia bacterium]